MLLTGSRLSHCIELGGGQAQRLQRRKAWPRDDSGNLCSTIVNGHGRGGLESSDSCKNGGEHLGREHFGEVAEARAAVDEDVIVSADII